MKIALTFIIKKTNFRSMVKQHYQIFSYGILFILLQKKFMYLFQMNIR
jgi:hypothetical protein